MDVINTHEVVTSMKYGKVWKRKWDSCYHLKAGITHNKDSKENSENSIQRKTSPAIITAANKTDFTKKDQNYSWSRQ